MKTSFPKPGEPKWLILDVKGMVLGRVATKIATVLRGRNKASFVPHWIAGDHIVVINADKIQVTGSKGAQKTYYRHAGYLGHLRETTFERMMKEKPTNVLRLAVKGMLPKNATRDKLLKRLHLFAGTEHDHVAQNPTPFPL